MKYFEWDKIKKYDNLKKHGIDFLDAIEIFNDPNRKVKSLTEKQILAAARSDSDAKPLTRAQLKKFKRVHPVKEIDVKAIRRKLDVSQQEFASYFGVSVRTIQEWEQHRRTPTTVARNFLKVIEKTPKTVLKALAA